MSLEESESDPAPDPTAIRNVRKQSMSDNEACLTRAFQGLTREPNDTAVLNE